MTTFASKTRSFRFPILQWLGRIFAYLILGTWTLFGIYAVGWVVLSSLSDTRAIFSNKLLDYVITNGPLFANYAKALSTHQMGRYFINSTIYVLVSLFLIVIIAAPASYVLSRFEFRGRKLFHNMFIAGMGIPGTLVMIPLFSMFLRLKLTGTLAGLITVYVCTSIPFTVYFLTGFFSSLPTELDDAARIDGCTDMGVFWRIMLPLSQPGLITVVVFNFIGLWNDYFWALIFANDSHRRTLALGLESLVQSMRYTGDWGGLFASIIIVFLPTFLMYIFLSEKIIAGITAGAVKT
jgi:raffinose/stachyose/melibiose transport system permease protein